ncbi:IclR family transcriptional regulator [Roseomonas sp. NAR14]|uniref:IclR family transcriptional regulator n=1 Tax=Roseomonas acroporae TaxID=2937791 RepID=A0A9X1YDZ4_9PROT|nr:IclR family transcriptional regulator [Roseomonas acroporae]
MQRALRLLDHLAGGGNARNLSETARLLDITRPTLARLLDTLEYERVVERLPEGGGYRLGLRFLGLAATALASRDLLRLAQPVLAGLAAELGLSAYLTVLSGGETLYLLREMPDTPLVSNIRLGSRVAAHLTAPGRMLLAHRPAEARRALLGPEPLAAATGRSVTTHAGLDRLLAEDRARGLAWSRAAYEAGIDACAVAILGGAGEAMAAISVAGPSAQFGTARAAPARVEQALRDAARDLSRLMGGPADGPKDGPMDGSMDGPKDGPAEGSMTDGAGVAATGEGGAA